MGRLLKGALAHKMRLVHTALAITLAVSLVSGTFALADTIDSAFHRAATASSDGVAVVVRTAAKFTAQGNSLSEREPVPESVLPSVEAVPGVKSAWGSVWGYAQIVDPKGQAISPNGLPTLGNAWAPADTLVAGRAPANADEVVIDENTAKAHDLNIGDRVKVLFQGAIKEFVIEGLRRVSNLVGSSLATFDLKTSQQVLGRQGVFDEIAVQAAPGVTPDGLRARIAGVLPDNYEVVTDAQAAKEAERSWTNALGFLTTGLFMFAMVALLVSAFIIFNTFSILVAQRTRELGLLRALGASRLQVTTSVLAEALMVGVVSSLAGIVAGYGAARALLALMRTIGFDVPPTSVVFTASAALAGLASGVLVTVAAAVVPARRATKASPVDGIGSPGGEEGGSLAPRRIGGAVFVGIGLLELVFGLHGNVARPLLAVAVGSVALLVGAVLLGPVVARPFARLMGRPLRRILGEPGTIGRENAMRNPRRTAATAAALMVGIGLIGVVTILAASMRASAAKTVEQTLRADFVVAPDGTAGANGGVSPLVADRLRDTPGVQMVSEVRGGQWGLDGKTMTLLAVDPATVTAMHASDDPASAEAIRKLSDKGVLVRDTVAARHKWKVGSQAPMTFARTGSVKLRLEGTFSSTSVRTDYIISLGAYAANYAQQLDLQVEVLLTPDTTAAVGRARIEKSLADLPGVMLLDRSQVLAAQEKQVKRFLVPITALLSLSVLIALLGIANTLALSIHERTRELGLLRAIGMARSQLRSMIRSEAVIVAALGALLGIALSLVFGTVLVSAMKGVGVTELVFPLRQLAMWIGVAVVAGLLAAALPARTASRMDVLDAVGAE
jgi:putative ABC transport system permease protein